MKLFRITKTWTIDGTFHSRDEEIMAEDKVEALVAFNKDVERFDPTLYELEADETIVEILYDDNDD